MIDYSNQSAVTMLYAYVMHAHLIVASVVPTWPLLALWSQTFTASYLGTL